MLPCLPTHSLTKRELCAAHLRQRGAACSAAGGPRLDARIVAPAPARLRPDGLDGLGHGLLELLGGVRGRGRGRVRVGVRVRRRGRARGRGRGRARGRARVRIRARARGRAKG